MAKRRRDEVTKRRSGEEATGREGIRGLSGARDGAGHRRRGEGRRGGAQRLVGPSRPWMTFSLSKNMKTMCFISIWRGAGRQWRRAAVHTRVHLHLHNAAPPLPPPPPRPRPNPRPSPRLAHRRALGSEDKADTVFALRHVQELRVLAALEVRVHDCRPVATLALLQRDLDAQSREIDRLGTANQLHLGEGGSEGEGEGEGEDEGEARVEGEGKVRASVRLGEGRVVRVKARESMRVGWQ